MRRHNRLRFTIYFLLAASPLRVFSQSDPKIKATVQKVSQELQLTPEQKTNFVPILTTELGQLRSLQEDTTLTQLQKTLQGIDIRESFRPKLNAVLTPRQQAKWNEIERQSTQQVWEKKPSA